MYHLKCKFKQLSLIIFVLKCLYAANTLTVDNQLVSARNDCFERIALEAMLPFEKTFRTEDTNSLKMCKEKCLQTGEKCRAISFGVHRRGNGTCQLSEEQYGATGGRPGGVIFDPDFDLYIRKTNCFDLSDNTISMPPVNDERQPSPLSNDDGGNDYGAAPLTPPLHRPIEGTPLLVVDPSPPTTGHTLQDERPSPQGPGSTITPPSGDRFYFTHDIYPLYKYPTLYDHNYPAPNEDIYFPGGYAANVPEVDDRYRPDYALADDSARPKPHIQARPIFGLGYGHGYGYGNAGHYTPTTMRPSDAHDMHPSYMPKPLQGYDDKRLPQPGYDDLIINANTDRRKPRPGHGDGATTPYGPRPTSYEPNHDPHPDYTNRPDPPVPQAEISTGINSGMRPLTGYVDHNRDDYVRRNGSATHANDYEDDKTIATYFNPDDYLASGHKNNPMDYDRDRDRFGQPMDQMNRNGRSKSKNRAKSSSDDIKNRQPMNMK